MAAPVQTPIYIETDIATTNLSTQTGLEIIQINTRDAATDNTVTLATDKAYTSLQAINSLASVTFADIANATVTASLISTANGKTSALTTPLPRFWELVTHYSHPQRFLTAIYQPLVERHQMP